MTFYFSNYSFYYFRILIVALNIHRFMYKVNDLNRELTKQNIPLTIRLLVLLNSAKKLSILISSIVGTKNISKP